MSLYNALFGVNDMAPLLLKILDISPKGKWRAGRFRDIYLNEDGTRILLYTRNGGGNREHWGDGYEENGECLCPGCVIEKHLPKHPNYLCDYDDSFDCTYATIVFSVPEEYQEDLKKLAKSPRLAPETISERFKRLVADMEAGKKTEETKKAEEVGKVVVAGIEDGKTVIEV
jgi:hypothetical protein